MQPRLWFTDPSNQVRGTRVHGNAMKAARDFLNRLDEMDWRPVGEYTSSRRPMTVECPQGHEQDIRPGTWRGTCQTCNPYGSHRAGDLARFTPRADGRTRPQVGAYTRAQDRRYF